MNCVRWMSSEALLTGDADGSVAVWSVADADGAPMGNREALLSGHEGAVTSLGSCRGGDWVVSAAGDASVRIYRRGTSEAAGETWDFVAELKFGPHQLQLAVEIFEFYGEVFLVCGGVDGILRWFVWNDVESQMLPVMKLRGHENWIRAIAFMDRHEAMDSESGNIQGWIASSDQDGYVRLWKLLSVSDNQQIGLKEESFIQDLNGQGHTFTVSNGKSNKEFVIVVESVIEAHDDGVTSLQWHPKISSNGLKNSQPLKLLSASMDQTMSIWEPDSETGIWLNEVHVGEIGGHNKLGFVSGKFSPDGQKILANSFIGSLHLWASDESSNSWLPELSPSGHFGRVSDISWDVHGNYLLSTSKDQTTRIFSRWHDRCTWNEIARPQVHGFDMACVCAVNSKPFQFVSGAEEKVIRVFDGSNVFLRSLKAISKSSLLGPEHEQEVLNGKPLKVTLPELGLSNKASAQEWPAEFIDSLSSPPLEETLLSAMLFPEVYKLYGHGYELYSLCSAYKANLVASSCVAKHSQGDHAAIIIWDSESWKELYRLTRHQLTVVQMEFSHSDRFLLSVSRDRQLCIHDFSVSPPRLIAQNSKAHARIIWSCSWSHDDLFFATGSRDKKVKIWSSSTWKIDSTLDTFSDSVTAVAFAPLIFGSVQDSYILAVALESGQIFLYSASIRQENLEWTRTYTVQPRDCHAGAVNRLRWHSLNNQLLLASCGNDHSVRIFSMRLDH